MSQLVQKDAQPAPREPDAQELMPRMYEQLRAMARERLRHERPGHTLQATALVHEVFLRLVGSRALCPRNRREFFTAAAEAMRRILIDHARRHGRMKRGGGCQRLSLDLLDLAAQPDVERILAVDEAIERLREQDPRLAEIVRLRFFAGLSVDETAAVLEMSDRTVRRDWRIARAWLQRELCSAGS